MRSYTVIYFSRPGTGSISAEKDIQLELGDVAKKKSYADIFHPFDFIHIKI